MKEYEIMNEKFFELPYEKRLRIINAGFRVFSESIYKKSPMSEIAAEAGISKSLLFHYFKNKKELYLFLWNEAGRITHDSVKNSGCFETNDLFEAMELGLKGKIKLMREYPYVSQFSLKAFYETDSAVSAAVSRKYNRYLDAYIDEWLKHINTDCFRDGLDMKMMFKDMSLAAEGYLWEAIHLGKSLDVDKLEKDFHLLFCFWKKVYTKDGEHNECGDSQKSI